MELDTERRGADSVDREINGATSSGGPRGFLTTRSAYTTIQRTNQHTLTAVGTCLVLGV